MEVDDADDETKGEEVGEEGEHAVLVSEERALHSISDPSRNALRCLGILYIHDCVQRSI